MPPTEETTAAAPPGSAPASDPAAPPLPPAQADKSGADSGLDIPPPGMEVDLDALAAQIRAEHDATSGVEKPKAKEEAPKEAPKAEADAEKKVEPATEEKPKTEKESAFIRAVKAREAKLVAERTQFRQQVQEVEQKVIAVRADLEKREAQIREQADLAAKDPLAYLEKFHGFTAADLARRVLNDGKPAEDEVSRKAMSRIDQLEADLRKEREAARQERETAQRAQARQADEQAFVAIARSDKFPELKAYKSDAALLRAAYDAAAIGAKSGHMYTHEEIAEALAEAKRVEYNELRSVLGGEQPQAASKKTAAQAATKPSENGSGHQASTAGATAGPTLSNRVTAERASIPRVVVDMDPMEERQLLIAEAERAAMNGA